MCEKKERQAWKMNWGRRGDEKWAPIMTDMNVGREGRRYQELADQRKGKREEGQRRHFSIP